MTGQTISHYRILEKLGEGGMGAVYKAEDVRLKRTVALKFLPNRLALTEEDRERFLREAQAAASLDHPNICTIYEIDEAQGRPFLAMAFVEGRGLDRRIEEGPLALKDALDIARQAAEGLRTAHNKGIVHRDIKSSNLMLADEQSGRPQVKLLDFGLAQLAGRSKLTQADTLMGTVAYMSPEQTEGGQVDARTDIWSLGVVLYEMVAGDLPFKGHYDQATLYSILNEEPQPLTALRSKLPVEIDWIVDKCLAKAPAERYQTLNDLILDLTTLEKKLSAPRLSIHRTNPPTEPAPAVARKAGDAPRAALRWKRLALALGGLAAALTIAVVALALVGSAEPDGAPAALRFDINLPNSLPVGAELRSLAISPDGRRIAFTVSGDDRSLWLRDLSQPAAYALGGTDGAGEAFWSPDSQTVGYRAEGQLRRIPAGGGPSSLLCEIPGQYFGGASFTEDGERVLFTAGPPMQIYEVSARGGQPTPLLDTSGEGRRGFAAYPKLIGKDALLYSGRTPQGEQVSLRELSSGEVSTLAEGGAPFLTESGYIVYHTGRTSSEIWALPFSPGKLAATGEAFPVAQGGMLPSVSNDGTLVYVADPRSGPMRLVLHARNGETKGELGRGQASLRDPAISPDGRWVVAVGDEGNTADLWLYDVERKTRTRLTNTPNQMELSPVWSPDSERIAYTLIDGEGPPLLAIRNADGAGDARLADTEDGPLFPLDWRRSGGLLARTRGPGRGGLVEIQEVPDGRLEPQPVLEGELGVTDARFSSDGRYLVFESRLAEESQIVVRPYPAGAGRWQVAVGGESPRWTRSGREIVFRTGGRLMAVTVERVGEELLFGEPEELFQDPMLLGGPRRPGYAISRDGETIVLAKPEGRPSPPTIRVVLNWLAEYER